MFDLMKYFKRSNVDILQGALRKNMMISFNHGEQKLHDAIFGQRAILMVDQNEQEEVVAEPGEPEPFNPKIKIQHNTTTGQSYVFFDKEYFENLEESEVDEMIYQLYNQLPFNESFEGQLDLPRLDGTIEHVNTQIYASDFTIEEEEEKKEIVEGGSTCDSSVEATTAKDEAKSIKEESEKTTTIKVADMPEDDKLKNPKFKAGNASFNKGNSTSEAQVFRGGSKNKTVDDKSIKKIMQVQEILEHAIKGDDGGKSKTMSPSKRLNMRAIITESSENEYFTKHGEEGKDIKINLIIDRSGSMHGTPTKNANILVQAFNNLSFEYDELDVKIIYTESNAYYSYDLPVDGINSEKIWAFDRTASAEGISRTCEAHFARLKEADINLVYTDGSIMDDALDKARYKAQEVELVGLYVNENFTPEDIMRHVEQNKQYFTKTIIRKDAVGLVNELSNLLVLQKG